MIWYLLLFNAPVIVILIYLFTRGRQEPVHEPVHFEKKPISWGWSRMFTN